MNTYYVTDLQTMKTLDKNKLTYEKFEQAMRKQLAEDDYALIEFKHVSEYGKNVIDMDGNIVDSDTRFWLTVDEDTAIEIWQEEYLNPAIWHSEFTAYKDYSVNVIDVTENDDVIIIECLYSWSFDY